MRQTGDIPGSVPGKVSVQLPDPSSGKMADGELVAVHESASQLVKDRAVWADPVEAERKVRDAVGRIQGLRVTGDGFLERTDVPEWALEN